MKKKITGILTAIFLLLQMFPFSAFAATTGYELYVGGKQFTSSNLSYTMGRGTAVYDPSATPPTLTLNNADISINGDNTAIYSEISWLNIVIKGTVNINVVRTGSIDGDAVPFFGIFLKGYTTIKGSDADSTLNITSKNSYSSLNSGNFTCYGIYVDENVFGVSVDNLKLNITDNSDSAYAGKFAAVDARSAFAVTNSEYTVKNAYTALYDEYVLEEKDDYTYVFDNIYFKNVKIDAQCTGVGLDLNNGKMTFCDLYGTITAPIGISSCGRAVLQGTDSSKYLNITATSQGINWTGGELKQSSAYLNINAPTGICLSNTPFAITGGKTDISFSSIGIYISDTASSLATHLGEVKLTGNGGTKTVGIIAVGSLRVLGANLTITGVQAGIQSYTQSIEFSGGTTTITAAGAGYANAGNAAFTVSGWAVFTVNAPIGIQLTGKQKGSFTLAGGTVNLNVSSKGLNVLYGSGTVALNSGTLNVSDTNDSAKATGFYAASPFTVDGATLNFKSDCALDISVHDNSSCVKSGTINLSSPQIGMEIANNFTVSGGNINYKGSGFGIRFYDGTVYNFTGGKFVYDGSSIGLYCDGGTYNFSGMAVEITTDTFAVEIIEDVKTTLNFSGSDVVLCSKNYNYAMLITEASSSYNVTGGSLIMSGTMGGANVKPSSVGADYTVFAGSDRANAIPVASPTDNTYTNSEYVAVIKADNVTLTVENAKEGTTLTAKSGTAVTYTAKDAPSGQHFAYWNFTRNGKTEKVGTNATYTGYMPLNNATLTAVYENCSGGKATCTQKAVCSVCAKEYGALADHSLSLLWSKDAAGHWNKCQNCDYKGNYALHTYDSGVITTPATCVTEGVKTYTCTVCKATKTEPIAATGMHTWNDGEITKAPTCGKEGVKTYTCTVCKTTKTEPIAATGEHTYDSGVITTPATCDKEGVKTYTCTVCRQTRTESVAVTGIHAYDDGEITKAATCGTKGVKTFTCTVCKATKTEPIAATGNHSYNDGEITKAPTCGEKGEKTFLCTVCKATKTVPVNATGLHTWDAGEITTPATCVTEGEKTFTCTVCKQTKTESVSVTAHTLEKVEAKPATETEAGNNEYYICSVCQKVFGDSQGSTETTAEKETIAKLGGNVKIGDVDGDGDISAADARLALRASVGLENLSENETKAADVDKNGEVDAADARLILRASVGLEDADKW